MDVWYLSDEDGKDTWGVFRVGKIGGKLEGLNVFCVLKLLGGADGRFLYGMKGHLLELSAKDSNYWAKLNAWVIVLGKIILLFWQY